MATLYSTTRHATNEKEDIKYRPFYRCSSEPIIYRGTEQAKPNTPKADMHQQTKIYYNAK